MDPKIVQAARLATESDLERIYEEKAMLDNTLDRAANCDWKKLIPLAADNVNSVTILKALFHHRVCKKTQLSNHQGRMQRLHNNFIYQRTFSGCCVGPGGLTLSKI
jgi:hypothetical protein